MQQKEIKPSQAANESKLCKTCGLCCDGTLFLRAKLRKGENLSEITNTGITTILEDKSVFTLPCSCFDQYCTVYDQIKPKICSGFRCKLLNSYCANIIPEEKALSIIHDTVQKSTSIRNRLLALTGKNREPLETLFSHAERRMEHKPITPEFAQLQIDYLSLGLILKKYFRFTKKP